VKISFHATFLVLLLLGTLGSVLAPSWNDFSALASPGQGTLFATVPYWGELLKIAPSDGSLEIIGFTVNANNEVIPIPSLAFDPKTGTMYGGGGSNLPNLYTVNLNTAAVTLVGPTGEGNLVGLDFSKDGQLFAAVNPSGQGGNGGTHLATVDKNTGDTTIIGPFGVSHMGAIAFARDGTLYGATENNDQQLGKLYTINTGNGQATLVNQILLDDEPTIGGFASLQFSCGGILFAGGGNSYDDFGSINEVTGSFNLIANQVLDTIGGMAFDSDCKQPVGGNLLPIDTTSLLLAGAQSQTGIMLTLIIVSSGIGACFVIVQNRRKLKK